MAGYQREGTRGLVLAFRCEEVGPGAAYIYMKSVDIGPRHLIWVVYVEDIHKLSSPTTLWRNWERRREGEPCYDRLCRSGTRKHGHVKKLPLLPWPFGPHVAGYQIKDNTHTPTALGLKKKVKIIAYNPGRTIQKIGALKLVLVAWIAVILETIGGGVTYAGTVVIYSVI